MQSLLVGVVFIHEICSEAADVNSAACKDVSCTTSHVPFPALVNQLSNRAFKTWHQQDMENATLGKANHFVSSLPALPPVGLQAFQLPVLLASRSAGLKASGLPGLQGVLSDPSKPSASWTAFRRAPRLPHAQAVQFDEAGEVKSEGISEKKLIELLKNQPQSAEEIEQQIKLLEAEGGGSGMDVEWNYFGLKGTEWKLLYSNDDTTRSSPFFWAFRKALGRDNPILNVSNPVLSIMNAASNADAIFAITDQIPFKDIGEALQKFEDDTLVSKVRLSVDLPFLGSGLVTTTSQWKPVWQPNYDSKWSSYRQFGRTGSQPPREIELKIIKTQVLESTSPLPFLGGDTISFPSGEVLDLVTPGSSTVLATISYLSESLRITRNEHGKVFVFERYYSSP